MNDNIRLLCGDCLECLKEIPPGSVDMILADPPFGMTRNAWDIPIDLQTLWPLLRRVTKQNGAMLFFCQMPYSAELCLSNKSEFRYEYIWEKTNPTGFLNAKKMPLKYHEQILVFYRKLPTYNPQYAYSNPYIHKSAELKSGNYARQLSRIVTTSDGKRYPGDVIQHQNYSFGPDKGLHPTQKPVGLLKWLISTYSNPGEIILDFCMGSGSSGHAAVILNRKFIGIEKNSEYFKTAAERIGKALFEPTESTDSTEDEQMSFFREE